MDLVAVGVDGTPASLAALSWATAEARSRRGGLHLVYATGWSPFREHRPWIEHDLYLAADAALADLAATVRERAPDLRVTGEVRAGAPGEALLAVAGQAGLLVVGGHGATHLGLPRPGGVSGAVAAHADCPVVVVPAEWQEPGGEDPVVAAVDGSAGAALAGLWALDYAVRRAAPLAVLRPLPGQARPALAQAVRGARLLVVATEVVTHLPRRPACPVASVPPGWAYREIPALGDKVLAGRSG